MYEFKVEGMSCGHCVQAITRAVNKLDAKAKVVVDLSTHMVRIESEADPKGLAQEIEDAGYTVADSGS